MLTNVYHQLDFANHNKNGKRKYTSCFDCGNDACSKKRSLPKIVTDQQLRNLRHELGQNEMRGAFATLITTIP